MLLNNHQYNCNITTVLFDLCTVLFDLFWQIEQAWDALRDTCGDECVISPECFDVEHDLKLEKPIRIAILDTGVLLNHESILGRVARMRNFVPKWFQDNSSDDLTRDFGGYGTFSAALAVGGAYEAIPLGGGIREPLFQNGVAPFARLAVGKVFNAERHGDVEWMIKGLKWACDIDKTDSRRPVNADIVCMSVGMPRYHPGVRDVIYTATQKGKIIICCASNEEQENSYNIQYPARFGDVICVGSQSENGQPTTFTPAGREIDFLGPGEDVWSASSSGHDHVTKRSGTWIAAPYVAGVSALIVAYAEKVGRNTVYIFIHIIQIWTCDEGNIEFYGSEATILTQVKPMSILLPKIYKPILPDIIVQNLLYYMLNVCI